MENLSRDLRPPRVVRWKAEARCGRSVQLGDRGRGVILWILIFFGMIKCSFCSILPTRDRSTCLGSLDDLHTRGEESSLHHLLMYIASMVLLLYFLGVVKAIIGMRCPCVGMFGLNTLIELPRTMPQYHEPHLRHHRVVYDEQGYPVHPDTGKRTVRMISRYSEFCLNSVLFLVLPCAVLCTFFCRIFCYWRKCAQRVDTCPVCSAPCDRSPLDCADKDRLLPRSLGSRERCACDDAAEERDARYVALQLQKSRDSLAQSHCNPWRVCAGRGKCSSSSAELYLYQPKLKRPQSKDTDED